MKRKAAYFILFIKYDIVNHVKNFVPKGNGH